MIVPLGAIMNLRRHHHQALVAMANVIMAKNLPVQMIARLHLLNLIVHHNISLMEVADVFTTALDYRALPGTTTSNDAYVPHNTLIMARDNVFIIMFIMAAVIQWVLY
jgi:hypothetical protein